MTKNLRDLILLLVIAAGLGFLLVNPRDSQATAPASPAVPIATPSESFASDGWQAFCAPDGSFACDLPGRPVSVSDRRGNGFQARVQVSQDKYYTAGYAKPGADHPRERLKEGWQTMLAEMKRKGAKERAICMGGMKGVELSLHPDNRHLAMVRYFLGKDRIYILVAVDVKESNELQGDARLLFDSFRLLNKQRL